MTYGSTERVGLTMMRGVEWLDHRGSCGRPHETEIRILDADGHDLPPGEIGEIYMCRPEGMGPTFEYVGADPPPQTADDVPYQLVARPPSMSSLSSLRKR